MGIEPIEYRTWNGVRTGMWQRVLVVVEGIVRKDIRSKGVLVLLIIGSILVHLFPMMTVVFLPQEKLSASMMAGSTFITEPYMKNGLFALFSILLAAVVTSDLISADYHDNSFVLYFSRPIKPALYMVSKLGGAATVMALFCLLPPIIYCVVVMGTQTGPDYLTGLKVTGMTLGACLLTLVFFSGMGLMLSSLTKRKAYAGVGTFMAFLVPMILSEFFMHFNRNWRLLNPVTVLHYSYDLIYGFRLPEDINQGYHALFMGAYLLIPMMITYITLHRRAQGK